MAKIMVCVPTLDKVEASFFTSVLGMRYDGGMQCSYNVLSNSLVYEARNQFALAAINGKCDYMVSFDSDMVMEPDTLIRLYEGIEATGADLLSGIYFKRRLPTSPVILKKLDWYEDEMLGAQDVSEVYEDYPKDAVFEIAGCGMGCAIMRVDMLEEIAVAYRMGPFTPMPRLSEDYAFCLRALKLGKRLMCDSRIKPGHAGLKIYGEADWMKQRQRRYEEVARYEGVELGADGVPIPAGGTKDEGGTKSV